MREEQASWKGQLGSLSVDPVGWEELVALLVPVPVPEWEALEEVSEVPWREASCCEGGVVSMRVEYSAGAEG